jgi:hypothetical protein
LWWRGIDERDRQAYIQGVFWCTQIRDNISILPPGQPVQQAVERVNEWYVISDEDWKDPRSNERVDISTIAALQRIGIIRITKVTRK